MIAEVDVILETVVTEVETNMEVVGGAVAVMWGDIMEVVGEALDAMGRQVVVVTGIETTMVVEVDTVVVEVADTVARQPHAYKNSLELKGVLTS